MVLALALALLIGVSLGTLGSGGSIVTLPVLVYAAGVPVREAVAMSLVVVGTTAAAGSWRLARRIGIEARVAAIFAATGMIGAWAGARLTPLVSPATLLILFGALMLAAGVRLLTARAHPAPVAARRPWRCALAGLALGVLTGFLGVGGGLLIIPALLLFAGVDMKRAVPTSLAVIACNCAGGLAGQLHGANLDWGLTAAFTAAALAGMAGGTTLAARVSGPALQRVFAWAIVLLGSAIVARNLWVIAG